MRGLLADANIQGFDAILEGTLSELSLLEVLEVFDFGFYRFADFDLATDLDDRSLWRFCQDNELLLFTENRNRNGSDSLEAAIHDLTTEDTLPVLTVSDKDRFIFSRSYREAVAKSVAEIAFRIFMEHRNRGVTRMYLPLPEYL